MKIEIEECECCHHILPPHEIYSNNGSIICVDCAEMKEMIENEPNRIIQQKII